MFYDNLLSACESQNLKITPLVVECGGAAGSISKWKTGTMPNSDIVVKLAMRLNVSCDYLLVGKTIDETNNATSILEQELLTNFSKLDSRGRHKIHTTIYEELDRIEENLHKNEPTNKEDVNLSALPLEENNTA